MEFKNRTRAIQPALVTKRGKYAHRHEPYRYHDRVHFSFDAVYKKVKAINAYETIQHYVDVSIACVLRRKWWIQSQCKHRVYRSREGMSFDGRSLFGSQYVRETILPSPVLIYKWFNH